MEMEVICISSDDESDSQKKNKTDKILIKSIEIANGAIAHEEAEMLLNVNEKIEETNLKRKIVHIEKERTYSTEKRKKLDVDQDKSEVINKSDISCTDLLSETCFAESNCNKQPTEDQEIKTQLVVKEKKKISYISQDVFPLFLSLCSRKCPTNDEQEMMIIIDKLKRRYENLDPCYRRSHNFAMFLNEKRKAITNDSKKLYVHIQEVMNEMKKKIKKSSRTSQTSEIYDAVPSTSYAMDSVPINAVESDDDNEDDEDEDEDKNEDNDNEEELRTRIKIKKILHTMDKCDKMIKKLEEEEVDFNEENDSNYIKVERYKQKMIELYSKLCQLTGENADAGRVYLRPKHLSVTQIVAVDQAITNFINQKITERNNLKKKGKTFTDDLIFPDYRDILKCVSICNDKKNLGLDTNKQKQMATKAFKELGEYLQRSRRNDYWDTFSLYLENSEDPATKDRNLARKLAENRTEGEKRLAAVFEEFVQKQIQLKDQSNEGTTSEEEEEEEVKIEGITYEDKNDDILSVSSEEDSENEENANKIVEVNELPMEKNKSNINMINIRRAIDISNKITENTSSAKCNKIIEIKVRNENNPAISNGNNAVSEKTINHNKLCNSNTIPRNIVTDVDKPCLSNTIPRKAVTDVNEPCSSNTISRNSVTDVNKPCSSNTISRNSVTNVNKLCSNNTIPKNIVKPCSGTIIPMNVVTDVHKPCSSSTIPRNDVKNIVDTSNEKIHKPCSSNTIPRNDVKNVDTTNEKVRKPCSGNITSKNSKNDMKNLEDDKRQEDSLPVASTSNYTKDLPEAKVKDVSKIITYSATKDVAPVVTSTENAVMIVTTENVTDEATENMSNNMQSEKEKKPLLRVRSFAKPPETWQDNQHKIDKPAQKNAPKLVNQTKEIVDLTNEGTVKPVASKCIIQIGNKVVPIVKRHKVFRTSSNNIINVKNITNNYLKVNTRTGQIIAPVHDIRAGATIFRLPVQTINQNQLQNTNIANEISLKGKTVLKIVPTKSIIIPKPSATQSVSKQTDISSSITQSK